MANVSRGTRVLLQFALSNKKTELGKSNIDVVWGPESKGHFPESDNPVDTAHTVGFLSTNATWRTHSELFHLWYLRSKTVPKVWLLAFGCFYLLCVLFFLLPPLLTQNPSCHLWAINHVWGGETLQIWCYTWSGSSLVFFFCLLLSVTEEERFCPVHADGWQWKEVICIFYMLPKRKSWMNQSACLFFLILRQERRKKQAHWDRSNESLVMI